MLFNQMKVAAVFLGLAIAGSSWAWHAFATVGDEKRGSGSGQRAGNAPPSASAPAPIKPRASVVEPAQTAPITTPITVRGRAIDHQGKPVSGATIYLVSTNGIDSPLGTTTTDRDGSYTFRSARLPVSRSRSDAPLAGTFQVYGTAPGHGFAWHGMRFYEPRRRPDDWKAAGEDYTLFGSDPKVIDLRFPPTAMLSGQIRDEKGLPVPDARIRIGHCDYLDTIGKESHHNFREFWAVHAAPAALTTTKTGRDGRFRLEGLPAEAGFWIHLEHPDYAWLSLHAATTSRPTTAFDYPRESTVGSVRPPVATGEINVSLHSTRQIAVRSVFADSGRPAPRVRISASQGSAATGYGANGITDGDGTLRFRLPPGEYDILADPTAESADVVRTRSTFSVTAKLAEQSLEVRVNQGCVLFLEVVDAKTHKGIPGLQFMAEMDGSHGREPRCKGGRVTSTTPYPTPTAGFAPSSTRAQEYSR